ncbi:MAG: hypothetical protein GEV13_28715 [Rhodospirillales bacterium]|nr:hypothetical protein [Rhodospirillales bacterium]
MGKHVRHLGFLEILLGHEPALAPYQQIYRRLIRKAVADASAVASAEIEAKGPEAGLDDAMGRMVVLAEADDTLDRLSRPELAAIVEGTDDVLDFLSAAPDDVATATEALPSVLPERREDRASFRCIGGRGGIDDAAAVIFAFALRRQGFEAVVGRRGEPDGEQTDDTRRVLPLICYASHPSDAVRRYNRRKLPAEQALQARHAVIDYNVAPAPTLMAGVAGPHDLWVGDIASICRFAAHHALAVEGR